MSEQDPVFEIRNLDVSFSLNRGTSRVVRGVDLDIYRDETLGIVGESGSGKSMLATALMNAVVEPGTTTGSITYYPSAGSPVSVLELSDAQLRRFRWEEVAMVFQGAMSSFNPVMSIEHHFRETLQDHGRNVAAGIVRARTLLESVYLDPDRVLDAYPHELSGGMKQRTLIALSLIMEPDVLVMDEPTGALDLLMQRSIVALLEEIQSTHELTIVFITHDLPLLSKLVDRITVMYAFQLVETGTVDEILYDAAHPYTRALLGATPDLTTSVEEMHPIEGTKPDPVERIDGCSYRPRCPLADEQCATRDPPAEERTTTHRAACFHSEDAASAVPIRGDTRTGDES